MKICHSILILISFLCLLFGRLFPNTTDSNNNVSDDDEEMSDEEEEESDEEEDTESDGSSDHKTKSSVSKRKRPQDESTDSSIEVWIFIVYDLLHVY